MITFWVYTTDIHFSQKIQKKTYKRTTEEFCFCIVIIIHSTTRASFAATKVKTFLKVIFFFIFYLALDNVCREVYIKLNGLWSLLKTLL